jgi:hypothetical protein
MKIESDPVDFWAHRWCWIEHRGHEIRERGTGAPLENRGAGDSCRR